jgi:hypothetical protein
MGELPVSETQVSTIVEGRAATLMGVAMVVVGLETAATVPIA